MSLILTMLCRTFLKLFSCKLKARTKYVFEIRHEREFIQKNVCGTDYKNKIYRNEMHNFKIHKVPGVPLLPMCVIQFV